MFVPDEAQVRAAVDFNERLNVPQIRPFYRWEVDQAWMAGREREQFGDFMEQSERMIFSATSTKISG
jgi:hypothetical protein